jgi:superfamily I DNA/RNA helicase
LLPPIAAGVPAATSVRAGEGALRFAPAAALAQEVQRTLQAEGSVGVIVPDALVESVHQQLADAGITAEELDLDADPRVTLVPASEAKGLEFDSVVLVEPAGIVAGEPTRTSGLRRLYVVLTRAVSRLTVLHDEPLPDELAV